MSIINEFFYSVEKTDQREGFSDQEMVEKSSKVPEFESVVKTLFEQGFRYGGDTKSDSRAFTDIEQKRIYIGKNKTVEEACLSLFYEMTNARNQKILQEIIENHFSVREESDEKATQYAHDILKVEAEAVFERCKVAQILNLVHLLKNTKYVEIIKASRENYKQAISEIFEEMILHGKVHNGKKLAVDHYKEMFFLHQKSVIKRSRWS
jgi:hypothetical protein